MGNKKITMQKLRQVLRFYSQGKGTKNISSIVGMRETQERQFDEIFQMENLVFFRAVTL